jgi:hypothetical protein
LRNVAARDIPRGRGVMRAERSFVRTMNEISVFEWTWGGPARSRGEWKEEEVRLGQRN